MALRHIDYLKKTKLKTPFINTGNIIAFNKFPWNPTRILLEQHKSSLVVINHIGYK